MGAFRNTVVMLSLLVLPAGPLRAEVAFDPATAVPTQWRASGQPAPTVNVPTDGYIDLGIELRHSFCQISIETLDTLPVTVTRQGASGEAELVPGAAWLLDFVAARWTPTQHFEPNTTYTVTVELLNSELSVICGSPTAANQRSDFTFTTGAGEASGSPPTPDFVATLTERTCGSEALTVRFAPTEHHPYVTYTATDLKGERWALGAIQGAFSVTAKEATIDSCLDIVGTHGLSGTSSAARVCAAEAGRASLCEPGCSSTSHGSPTTGVLAGALAALWLLARWRRRRRTGVVLKRRQ